VDSISFLHVSFSQVCPLFWLLLQLCRWADCWCIQVWCNNSHLPADHVVAGSFETAMRVTISCDLLQGGTNKVTKTLILSTNVYSEYYC